LKPKDHITFFPVSVIKYSIIDENYWHGDFDCETLTRYHISLLV
jgi:hypothetical protein